MSDNELLEKVIQTSDIGAGGGGGFRGRVDRRNVDSWF